MVGRAVDRLLNEQDPPLEISAPAGTYRADRWHEHLKCGDIIDLAEFRNRINQCGSYAGSLQRHAHTDVKRNRLRAELVYEALERLSNGLTTIKKGDATLISYGGVLWSSVQEAQSCILPAYRAFASLQAELSKVEADIASFLHSHPLRPFPKGNNVDWLARGLLRALRGVWSDWTGKPPAPTSRRSDFIKFSSDVFRDLKIPVGKDYADKIDDLEGAVAEKWIGLNKSGG